MNESFVVGPTEEGFELMSKGLNVASAPIPLVLNKTSGVTSIVIWQRAMLHRMSKIQELVFCVTNAQYLLRQSMDYNCTLKASI